MKDWGECRGAADPSFPFSSPAQLTFSSSGLSFQSQPHSWFLMNFQLISGKSWSIFANSPAITWLWSFTLLSAFLPTHLLLRFQFDLHLSLTTSQLVPSLLPLPCLAQPHSPCLSPCDSSLLSNIPFIPLCSSSLLGCVSWNEKCSFTSSPLGQSLVLKPVKSHPKPAFPLKQTVQRRLGFTTLRFVQVATVSDHWELL